MLCVHLFHTHLLTNCLRQGSAPCSWVWQIGEEVFLTWVCVCGWFAGDSTVSGVEREFVDVKNIQNDANTYKIIQTYMIYIYTYDIYIYKYVYCFAFKYI